MLADKPDVVRVQTERYTTRPKKLDHLYRRQQIYKQRSLPGNRDRYFFRDPTTTAQDWNKLQMVAKKLPEGLLKRGRYSLPEIIMRKYVLRWRRFSKYHATIRNNRFISKSLSAESDTAFVSDYKNLVQTTTNHRELKDSRSNLKDQSCQTDPIINPKRTNDTTIITKRKRRFAFHKTRFKNTNIKPGRRKDRQSVNNNNNNNNVNDNNNKENDVNSHSKKNCNIPEPIFGTRTVVPNKGIDSFQFAVGNSSPEMTEVKNDPCVTKSNRENQSNCRPKSQKSINRIPVRLSRFVASAPADPLRKYSVRRDKQSVRSSQLTESEINPLPDNESEVNRSSALLTPTEATYNARRDQESNRSSKLNKSETDVLSQNESEVNRSIDSTPTEATYNIRRDQESNRPSKLTESEIDPLSGNESEVNRSNHLTPTEDRIPNNTVSQTESEKNTEEHLTASITDSCCKNQNNVTHSSTKITNDDIVEKNENRQIDFPKNRIDKNWNETNCTKYIADFDDNIYHHRGKHKEEIDISKSAIINSRNQSEKQIKTEQKNNTERPEIDNIMNNQPCSRRGSRIDSSLEHIIGFKNGIVDISRKDDNNKDYWFNRGILKQSSICLEPKTADKLAEIHLENITKNNISKPVIDISKNNHRDNIIDILENNKESINTSVTKSISTNIAANNRKTSAHIIKEETNEIDNSEKTAKDKNSRKLSNDGIDLSKQSVNSNDGNVGPIFPITFNSESILMYSTVGGVITHKESRNVCIDITKNDVKNKPTEYDSEKIDPNESEVISLNSADRCFVSKDDYIYRENHKPTTTTTTNGLKIPIVQSEASTSTIFEGTDAAHLETPETDSAACPKYSRNSSPTFGKYYSELPTLNDDEVELPQRVLFNNQTYYILSGNLLPSERSNNTTRNKRSEEAISKCNRSGATEILSDSDISVADSLEDFQLPTKRQTSSGNKTTTDSAVKCNKHDDKLVRGHVGSNAERDVNIASTEKNVNKAVSYFIPFADNGVSSQKIPQTLMQRLLHPRKKSIRKHTFCQDGKRIIKDHKYVQTLNTTRKEDVDETIKNILLDGFKIQQQLQPKVKDVSTSTNNYNNNSFGDRRRIAEDTMLKQRSLPESNKIDQLQHCFRRSKLIKNTNICSMMECYQFVNLIQSSDGGRQELNLATQSAMQHLSLLSDYNNSTSSEEPKTITAPDEIFGKQSREIQPTDKAIANILNTRATKQRPLLAYQALMKELRSDIQSSKRSAHVSKNSLTRKLPHKSKISSKSNSNKKSRKFHQKFEPIPEEMVNSSSVESGTGNKFASIREKPSEITEVSDDVDRSDSISDKVQNERESNEEISQRKVQVVPETAEYGIKPAKSSSIMTENLINEEPLTRPTQLHKGREALLSKTDEKEKLITLSKGWINFYSLRNSQESSPKRDDEDSKVVYNRALSPDDLNEVKQYTLHIRATPEPVQYSGSKSKLPNINEKDAKKEKYLISNRSNSFPKIERSVAICNYPHVTTNGELIERQKLPNSLPKLQCQRNVREIDASRKSTFERSFSEYDHHSTEITDLYDIDSCRSSSRATNYKTEKSQADVSQKMSSKGSSRTRPKTYHSSPEGNKWSLMVEGKNAYTDYGDVKMQLSFKNAPDNNSLASKRIWTVSIRSEKIGCNNGNKLSDDTDDEYSNEKNCLPELNCEHTKNKQLGEDNKKGNLLQRNSKPNSGTHFERKYERKCETDMLVNKVKRRLQNELNLQIKEEKSELSITGCGIIPDRKPKIPTLSERDLIRMRLV